jgi:Cu-Zn family superoxide dismutase
MRKRITRRHHRRSSTRRHFRGGMSRKLSVKIKSRPVVIKGSDRIGVAVFKGESGITGTVEFRETMEYDKTEIIVNLRGLTPGYHGFHVHETGNIEEGCQLTGDHYNPTNNDHGSRTSDRRHAGDLGNIYANKSGVANEKFMVRGLSMRGALSIIGRSIVIHAEKDTLSHEHPTGNSGDRIACATIGWRDALYPFAIIQQNSTKNKAAVIKNARELFKQSIPN